jgi:hypothetical protein
MLINFGFRFKEGSLLLADRVSGADVSVTIAESSVIRVVKKSRALPGAGIGFAASAASLMAVWAATDSESFSQFSLAA